MSIAYGHETGTRCQGSFSFLQLWGHNFNRNFDLLADKRSTWRDVLLSIASIQFFTDIQHYSVRFHVYVLHFRCARMGPPGPPASHRQALRCSQSLQRIYILCTVDFYYGHLPASCGSSLFHFACLVARVEHAAPTVVSVGQPTPQCSSVLSWFRMFRLAEWRWRMSWHAVAFLLCVRGRGRDRVAVYKRLSIKSSLG